LFILQNTQKQKLEIMEILQQYFPRDIANMIDDMKSQWEHAECLQKCFVPLQIQVILRQLQQIEGRTLNRNQQELDCLYKEAIPNLEWALQLLAQCQCCVLHQEKKPTSTHKLQKSEYRVCCAPIKKEGNRKLTCKCPCRHFARGLTRAHLYTIKDHEEDNRCILHEVFLYTHEELKKQYAVLAELNKRKKQKLQQINSLHSDEDFLKKYGEYKCEYFQIISEIEEQEMAVHVCEEKDTEISHMLENHILDFPDIRNELDSIFTDMFIYPEYGIMYDTDTAESDIDNTYMTESDNDNTYI